MFFFSVNRVVFFCFFFYLALYLGGATAVHGLLVTACFAPPSFFSLLCCWRFVSFFFKCVCRGSNGDALELLCVSIYSWYVFYVLDKPNARGGGDDSNVIGERTP
ncbi:unnamed protein product, partial [Ectocarpus sp. 6 AP-2014]